MDTTYQDVGMLKAYGLVYQLTLKGIPVYWAISPTKVAGGLTQPSPFLVDYP